jgi:3-hydroxyisobutyrate dehydrogenase
MKIGFVGTGRMGSRMVANLVKGPHQVEVYDADLEVVNRLVSLGASGASSLQAACADKDILFTMLPTPAVTVENYCKKGGVLDNVGPKTIAVECGTIDIGSLDRLSAEASGRGVQFVDGPVTGGIEGAEAARLTFMIGGTEAQVKTLEPVLALMGKKIVHAGVSGSAMKLKIVNNMICATNLVVASEALALGLRLGLDARTMYEVISNGTGASWVFNTYYPLGGVVPGAPSSRGFRNPTFPVTGMIKDLGCALDAAGRTGSSAALHGLALSMLRIYGEQFGYDLDWTAVSTLFKAPAASERRS